MEYLRVLKGEYKQENRYPDLLNFSFDPDDFQKHSFQAINDGDNLLVTAHTGSGKSAIAEYAIRYFTNRAGRVFYTSPIKTLSNQKYADFRERFSDISVGLMTGDNKIMPDADCIVATTEILLNALYDVGKKDDAVKTKLFNDNFMESLSCVIFDEVHYINDPDRGHVWEETINLLDPSVTLIMLSATIDKSEEFAQWVGRIKGRRVSLVPTTHRVIPLEHYLFSGNSLFKILDKTDRFLDKGYNDSKQLYQESNYNYRINRLVEYLKENDLFQTIFFVFSRKKCEQFAKSVTINLVSHEERQQIEKIFDFHMHRYQKEYSTINQFHVVKELLYKGVAFHHSGLMPIMKEIMEIIFQKKLVKILFATETFAVGVNMPTRTVVFTEIEKFTNYNRRLLYPSEYKQMSGRAGRRGIDRFGYVILLPLYEFPSRAELRSVMLGKVPHIESKFSVNYSFILKIIQSNATNVEDFINRSLYNKDSALNINSQKKELEELRKIYGEQSKKSVDPRLKKHIEFLQLCEKYSAMGISLNKNQLKKKKSLAQELQKDRSLKQLLDEQIEIGRLGDQILRLEQQIISDGNFINDEMDKIIIILREHGYIVNSVRNVAELSFGDVTKKGVIGSQINECNPILLTEMIANHLFDDLEPEEIVGLLAIFIDDVKTDEEVYINDISNLNIRKKLNQIQGIINQFIDSEERANLLNDDFWEIGYNCIDIAHMWASGSSFHDIQNVAEIYEGNFIRNMLKLNNIAKDLSNLCEIYGDQTIIPKLEQIEQKIVRDIVVVNSLYINT